MNIATNREWAERCRHDGEFTIAARHWQGCLRLRIGDEERTLSLEDGVPSDRSVGDDAEILEYGAERSVWEKMLSARPPRFYNDLMANVTMGLGVTRSGDPIRHAQYFAAVMRAVELLRATPDEAPAPTRANAAVGRFDSPVGRYVHLDLNGHDHRIYFEEIGEGIPVLLQHTAGCHGSQWRHLFEDPEMTKRFRLIAYDLPYHGKSLPPTTQEWWAQPYRLEGEFLRSIPRGLSAALELDRPAFMGCSVGGLLALDLAHKHPDEFRAVISVEGALHIDGKVENLQDLYHPQVSNEYKARLMDGLMSPTSPKAYRKETSFVYASGWPPAFLGDLHYYVSEFDLRTQSSEIDTDRVGVHILSGEYDYSGTAELGRAAHAAIAGSTWTEMKDVGHFPMSENPAAFIRYLKPVLDQIR